MTGNDGAYIDTPQSEPQTGSTIRATFGIVQDALIYTYGGVGVRAKLDKKKGVPYDQRAGGRAKELRDRAQGRVQGADISNPVLRAVAGIANITLPQAVSEEAPAAPSEESPNLHVSESPTHAAARQQSEADGAFDATAPPPVVPLRTKGGFGDLAGNAIHVERAGQSEPTPSRATATQTVNVRAQSERGGTRASLSRLSTRGLQEIFVQNPDVLADVRRQPGLSRLGHDLTIKEGVFGKARPLNPEELKRVKTAMEQALDAR